MINAALGLVLAQVGIGQPEVTIYNQGFALVKDVRQVSLKQGRQTVAVEDVAQLIETNSVRVKSLSEGGFEVLEQNYQYDLISPIAILNKAVGSTIAFNRVLPNGQRERIEGKLLSSPTAMVGDANGGSSMTWNGMVIQTGDGRIILNPSGEIEVSSLPTGLISKPTLLWEIVAGREGPQNIELSYLSQGMGWKADYVLTLDGLGKADFKGWVTLTNNSGSTFNNAKLKLLAGDVNRIQPRMPGMARGGAPEAAMMDKGFAEESLFEYHLYTLQRPTNIRDKEMKQVSLLEALEVTVSKKLIVDSMMNFGRYYPSEGEVGTGPIKPLVQLIFTNEEKNKLGMALPMGTIKVYQRDKSGSVQMLGEDSIQHTPRNETIKLNVGRSFDVVAERKRTNFRRLSNNSFEETFEIEVRNRKDVPEKVHVIERHYGDWKITASTMAGTKLDSNTQEFIVNLAANEVKKISYTVQTRW